MANMLPIAPIVADNNCDAAKSHSADHAAGLPMKTIISKKRRARQMAARELSTTSYTMASQNMKLTHRMLSTILGYALSIHKLQGNTSNRLSLKVGENEFAARFLLVGCMWTKTFQGRSCLPFPNHERFL